MSRTEIHRKGTLVPQFPNLDWHFDASYIGGVTYNASNQVTDALDLVGNFTYTPATTAGNKLIYDPTLFNGKPAVYHPTYSNAKRDNRFTAIGPVSLPDEYTVVLVVKILAENTESAAVSIHSSHDNAGGAGRVQIEANNGTLTHDSGSNGPDSNNFYAYTLPDEFVLAITYDVPASLTTGYINGIQVFQDVSADGFYRSQHRLLTNRNGRRARDQALLGEGLGFTTNLTPAQVLLISTALRAKWNII